MGATRGGRGRRPMWGERTGMTSINPGVPSGAGTHFGEAVHRVLLIVA